MQRDLESQFEIDEATINDLVDSAAKATREFFGVAGETQGKGDLAS